MTVAAASGDTIVDVFNDIVAARDGEATLLDNLKLVQDQYSETSAFSSTTTAIPLDDTIPQNTEGVELLTVTITPKDAANILILEGIVMVAMTGSAGTPIMAFFKDSDAGSLAGGYTSITSSNETGVVALRVRITAGGVSAITFKMRMGPSAGTLNINGTAGARILGGVAKSTFRVTEIRP